MSSLASQNRRESAPRAPRPFTPRTRFGLIAGFILAAALTGFAILLAASPPQTGPLGPASQVILTVLGLNLVLILGLALVIGLRFLALRKAQANDAGARLHMRFVALFAFAAVAPAVVVALFYGVLVTRGVDNWFSQRVQTIVGNSATAAQSYLDEQQRYIGDHVTLMAGDLNNAAPALQASPVAFSHFLGQQAGYHGFSAAYLLDRQGRVLSRAEIHEAPVFAAPPALSFKVADEGDISMGMVEAANLMRAVYRLKSYPDAYLYVVRPVEKGIIAHLRETSESLAAYRDADQNRQRIQTVFVLSYFETALLVFVGAVWFGMSLATAISGPIGRLVQAAGRVAGGDLTARVDAAGDFEEVAVLSRAFNSMTNDLKVQQAALRQASVEAQERRQFIETVLSEVSAGVIGLDAEGRVSAANRQAVTLLGLPGLDHGRGRPLSEVAPELAAVTGHAMTSGDAEAEVDVVRGRETRRLRVRASPSERGLVLTFDDITRLVAAQRNAAWKDVARRIAHEIKNPLTPIQLSAERIRRKFRRNVGPEDLETFDRCTDTIVRQVGDIGRMVDEFSAFARMPAPRFADHDAAELLREVVFARRVAAPEINLELEEPAPEVTLRCDERMLAQALTNVLKNAAEAIAGRPPGAPKGRITARIVSDQHGVVFEVEDNGVGLPTRDRHRLAEPYVTTREKGTGLGLAIVKRILEDHGGDLVLTDAADGQGAKAILQLPASARAASPAPQTATA